MFKADGYTTFDFSLPDAEGNKVSLKDEKFKNKVVILTIGGTWCPNCMDEAAYVAPWYQKNKDRGVEVVGVQFERKTDPVYVKNAMENFGCQPQIIYVEVFGGVADKNAVYGNPGAKYFPILSNHPPSINHARWIRSTPVSRVLQQGIIIPNFSKNLTAKSINCSGKQRFSQLKYIMDTKIKNDHCMIKIRSMSMRLVNWADKFGM